MVAPETWSAPTSGGTVATTSLSYCSIGDAPYFTAISQGASSASPEIRYATDPTGAWGTATLPAAPVGYTSNYNIDRSSGIVYGAGTYAVLVRYGNGSAFKWRLLHATDPSGTWSSYEFDATDQYQGATLIYADGKWTMGGRFTGQSPQPAFLGQCATIDGTWMFDTSTFGTGYDTAGMSGTQYWEIRGIGYNGTHWVTTAYQSSTGITSARYSDTISSGGIEPASITLSGTTWRVQCHSNGWWTMIDASANIIAADDPTGTWTTITSSSHQLDDYLGNVVYVGGYWIAAGGIQPGTWTQPRVSYLRQSNPSGAWTLVDAGFTEPAAHTFLDDVAVYGDLVVTGSVYSGELRSCRVAIPPLKFRRAIGSGFRLRQRQTPFIT